MELDYKIIKEIKDVIKYKNTYMKHNLHLTVYFYKLIQLLYKLIMGFRKMYVQRHSFFSSI